MKSFKKALTIILFVLTVVCAVKNSASIKIAAQTAEIASTSAKSAVVMEVVSGRVLFSKNPNQPLPIASTTKILTALTVLENCNVNSIIVVPKQAVGIEGSSIYLVEGERLTVKELLYGLMLRSGNDAATALALHCGGTIEGFAQMMNETAQKLGCQNSNFVNPHGLHDDKHFCSALDLAKISSHAMKDEIFREIVSTKTIKISNEKFDYLRVLYNKNKLLGNLETANGIKTGFTKKAGRCFVGSSISEQGMQLVSVLLNCGPMFEECESLLRFFGEKYEMKNITQFANAPNSIAVSKGKAEFVETVVADNFYFPLLKDGSEDSRFLVKCNVSQKLTAPVKKGDIAGEILIYENNQLIFSTKIVSMASVERKSIFNFMFPSETAVNEIEQIYGGLRSCQPQSV